MPAHTLSMRRGDAAGPATGAAALVLLMLILCAAPAQALKDQEAREEIVVLRNQLNQMESSLQVRQMGLGEQIQAIREDLARIESRVDENRRSGRMVGQQLDVAKIETQENLIQVNHDYQKRFEVIDGNIGRLAAGIEDLQENIRTLSDNLRAMSDFEKRQEEKITQIQGQLQQKLEVVVEEVGRENARLQNEIAAVNQDIIQFQELVTGMDGDIRALGEQLREVARRQEAMAGAAGGAGGTHTVQKGESLSLIATRYGVTVEAIMAANGLSDANLIHVGQSLVIP